MNHINQRTLESVEGPWVHAFHGFAYSVSVYLCTFGNGQCPRTQVKTIGSQTTVLSLVPDRTLLDDKASACTRYPTSPTSHGKISP